jgi:hypothetical protein
LNAEQWASSSDPPTPDWILYVPESYLNRETRQVVEGFLRRGQYEPRVIEGGSALLEHVPPPGDSFARRSSTR